MNPALVVVEKVVGIIGSRSNRRPGNRVDQPTVMVATMDPAIRVGLTELLEAYSVRTIWSQGVETAKKMLAREKIAACVCGFWLQDGTYRELIRHIRRERVEIPVIIASAPACPEEYRDFLGAMNLGALDFLRFPYEKRDLEAMLRLTLEPNTNFAQHDSGIGDNVMGSEAA